MNALARPLAVLLCFLTIVPPDWATCGGGGGGGMGGMGGGAGTGPQAQQQVYYVPWKLHKPEQPAQKPALVLYWVPSSADEVRNSSLRVSRTLSLYASQCTALEIVDPATQDGQKLAAGSTLPVVVLTEPDGTVVQKAENKNGRLNVSDIEKLMDEEVKKREKSLDQQIDSAKEKAKAGDSNGAIPVLRAVVEQKCLFPKKAKEAAKELKKLGVNVGEIPASPAFDAAFSKSMVSIMQQGLEAENTASYVKAESLYQRAHRLDPADPTPLRYLGELYRHHIGDWAKARSTFDAILAMPADPLSRAVAQHGLGKMTIHEGEFKKGLHLMEASVETFPLALAYRNLAVYWNSEGNAQKTAEYVHLAMQLEPHETYNQVFAAVFLAQSGHADEALKIARANEALLPASYNLAAIYAQAGDKEKALALLKRHFYEYERYQSVRSKEMMEARVDAVFASLMKDPAFLALTKDADGRLPMPAMAAPESTRAGGGNVSPE